MANIEKKDTKKIFFILSLIAATVLLTIVFSSEDYQLQIKIGRKNILEYYVSTLKPLLASGGINKKEIFEFATTGKIPAKNSNKNIVVSSAVPFQQFADRNNIFSNTSLNGYDNFVKFFSLTKREQKQLDSILLSYQAPLSVSILIGQNGSMAVNSDLDKIRTALAFDIQRFEAQLIATRFPNAAESILKIDNNKVLQNLREKVIKSIGGNFTVYSGDSVFTIKSKIDFDSLFNYSEKKREKLLKKLRNNFSMDFSVDSANDQPYSGKIIFRNGKSSLSVIFEKDTSAAEEKLSRALNLNLLFRDDTSRVGLNIKVDTTKGKININMNVNSPDTSFNSRISFDVHALKNMITERIKNKNIDRTKQDSILKALDSIFSKLPLKLNGDSINSRDTDFEKFFGKMFREKMRKEK